MSYNGFIDFIEKNYFISKSLIYDFIPYKTSEEKIKQCE